MSGWSFAFSKRWAGYLALTVVFAIVCSMLGMWQFSRRADARAEIDRIDTNYDASPIPVDSALDSLDSFEDDQRWLPVLLEGNYLADEEVLVRNRPRSGQPGFEVLTPFLLTDGSVFIVDRGWLPTGSEQDLPDDIPAPPTGEVTVSARLKAGEPVLGSTERVEGTNQIRTVHLEYFADELDAPVYTGAYGLVATQSPEPAEAPLVNQRPVRDEGPHLSYALQWFVFAVLGFIGLGWALRQEYRVVNADDPDEVDRATEREKRRAARAPNDDDIEDAILESADRR
ncbi:SURF1 family protein [Marisediminicola sp. LYQ134]|uniref:SURF1 family cytochrome oxidase biogenesis protein n=1 Tax=Marisediminicola sp. LYQ134 TaxID=3391061 RepID=UPI0039836AB3